MWGEYCIIPEHLELSTDSSAYTDFSFSPENFSIIYHSLYTQIKITRLSQLHCMYTDYECLDWRQIVSHSSRRSGIPSCWTMVVKQPSVQPTTVQAYPSSVPPGVKDVFVWLTKTPAPSDFCFFVCYTNVLTYLITYKKAVSKHKRWPGLKCG